MSFASALRAAQMRPTDPDVLSELARTALDEGEEERALPAITRAVASNPTARLWQWKGLLERALDEHERACASFEAAVRLDPADAGIAHGLARASRPGRESRQRRSSMRPFADPRSGSKGIISLRSSARPSGKPK